jgi:nitroimidazol reductase NimA-like FMN-containing flavoprotein (pyridoxamine 5'-phosphate oxidase superfamily)
MAIDGQQELAREEALRLLATVPLGRVVFTDRALPAIRPVNHIVDGRDIVFRTSSSAAITTAVHGIGTIVAFEADAIDSARRAGWSVVVIGGARVLTDTTQIEHYRQLLRPWTPGTKDDFIAVRADVVSGVRIDGSAAWEGDRHADRLGTETPGCAGQPPRQPAGSRER